MVDSSYDQWKTGGDKRYQREEVKCVNCGGYTEVLLEISYGQATQLIEECDWCGKSLTMKENDDRD